jgi:hypothetical protein
VVAVWLLIARCVVARAGVFWNPFHSPLSLRQKPSRVFDCRERQWPSAKIPPNSHARSLADSAMRASLRRFGQNFWVRYCGVGLGGMSVAAWLLIARCVVACAGVFWNPFHPPLSLRQKPSRVFDCRERQWPSAKIPPNSHARSLTDSAMTELR